uniref:Molybdopterin molybdenumtransferase MoeA n=1 Tax=Gongylonema pulchrum TaxID=637853 RepID=A0A183F1K9_9BILA
LIVQLPVENCGAGLLKTLSSSSLQLDDVFRIGQMLAFKVLKPAAPKQGSK